jgi:hypothetical protein
VEFRSLLSPQARANFNQLQLAFRKNRDDFIRVEVEIGLTFAVVGLEAQDASKRARNLRSAHKAYRTAYRSFAQYGVSSPDMHSEIVDRLAELRGLLERLRPSKEGCRALLGILECGPRVRAARAEVEAG